MGAARNGSILIVEDEWLVRREIAEELERAGWHVVEMSNAQDAIDELGRRAFRVVITDIGLGRGLSGWDVGRACATKGNTCNLRIRKSLRPQRGCAGLSILCQALSARRDSSCMRPMEPTLTPTERWTSSSSAGWGLPD
jgi:CheY-like chemotaxis protein